MDPLVTKILTLVITLVATMFVGLIPVWLMARMGSATTVRGRKTSESLLSFLNCFSGGVFLAVTMIHLLPDVRRDFGEIYEKSGIENDFSVAEFCACIGFFIVMFIENVIVQCQRSSSVKKHPDSAKLRVDVEDTAVVRSEIVPIVDSAPSGSDMSDSGMSAGNENRTQRSAPEGESNPRSSSYGSVERSSHNGTVSDAEGHQTSLDLSGEPDVVSAERIHRSVRGSGGTVARYASLPREDDDDVRNHRHRHSSGGNLSDRLIDSEEAGKRHEGHSHSHGPFMDTDASIHSLRSLVLLIALSIHTVFEGMALGLQDSNKHVWMLFIAIIIHKLIMAFTVGLRFIESLGSVRRTVLYMLIFAVMSPIGIGIGAAVSEAGSSGLAATIVSAILQGIATGTFLYVTFFEVLLEEMTNNQNCGKVLALIVGFTCITMVELLAEHD